MKVISPIFGSMSGKLGGAVAATARGGVAYMRKRVKPGNPRSTHQTTVRLIMTALAAAWRSTLTATQRTAWETISPTTSSGIDSYTKGNMQALIAGLTRTDNAPSSLALVTDPIISATYNHTTHVLTLTGTATANVLWNAYVSTPQSASRLSQQFPYQFAGEHAAAATATITLPTTHPAYNATAGTVVYVQVAQFGDPATPAVAGQTSTPQTFRVTVT